MKIRAPLLCFSPSARTASPLGSDCESEAFGLIATIRKKFFSKCPSLPPVFVRKADVQRAKAREGKLVVPPVSLPFLGGVTHLIIYIAEFVQKKEC